MQKNIGIGRGNHPNSRGNRAKYILCEARNCIKVHELPADYHNLHRLIRRLFGLPSKCDNCGTTKSKRFEWAKISEVFNLHRWNWARLCVTCHRGFDFGIQKKVILFI